MKKASPYHLNGNGERFEIVDFEVFLSLIFIGRKTIWYTFLFIVIFTGAYSGLMRIKSPQYESTAKILAEPQKDNNPYYIEFRSEKERMMFLETQKEILVSEKVIRKSVAEINKKEEKDVTEKEINRFRRQIKVSSRSGMGKTPFSGTGIGESNTFFVTVRATNPKVAAENLSVLLKTYLGVSYDVNTDKSSVAKEILDSAVKESKESAKAKHQALVDFESKAGSLLPELMNMNKPTLRLYPELESIRAGYEQAKTEIAQKKSIIEILEQILSSKDEPPVPAEILAMNTSIQVLKDKITDLRLKLNELKPFYNDSSREISSVQDQIDLLERTLRKEVKLTLEGAKASLQALESAQNQRETTLNDYDEKMKKLSELNSVHAELRRAYQSAGDSLDSQYKDLAEATISAAKRSNRLGNIAIIDEGKVNYKCVAPNIIMNCIIAAILGLAIGILLILFSQLIHPIFVHPRQIERATGVLVVASLNSMKSSEEK